MRLSEEEYTRLLRRGPDGTLTETQLLTRVREVLKRAGYLTYHTWSSKRSEPGFPDLVAVPDVAGRPQRQGTTCYILELKREGEHPTLAQQRWLEALARVDTVQAAVLRPSTLEAFVRGLPR